MHEISIATGIVDLALEAVEREKVKRVICVYVDIGVLSGVVQECLEFAFPDVCSGTLLEGCELICTKIPLTLKCRSCKQITVTDIVEVICKFCGSVQVSVLKGAELQLTKMEVS